MSHAWEGTFSGSSLKIVETPVNFTRFGYNAIPAGCVVISHASTYTSGYCRWTGKAYYVQDEYRDNFPNDSKIKKWSDFATDYPEEKPIVIDY